MICSSCGNALSPDVRFCPHCGAPIVFATQQGSPVYPVAPYTRVSRHLQILGILWLVYAGMRVVKGIAGALILHGIFGMHGHSNWDSTWTPFGTTFLSALWPIVVVSTIVTVASAILTGYALLTRQPWGRILAIVFGVFALIHPILGTALGIYTLWVLAISASGLEYDAIAASTPRV